MATLKLNPAVGPVLGEESPMDGRAGAFPAERRSLSTTGLVQVSAGLAYAGWRVAAALGLSLGWGDAAAWWMGTLGVCAVAAAMAHVGAGTLLLNRRRATPAAVLWTQHAAVWTLAPVFLLQAVATVILGRNAWVTGERLWIAQAAEALGACLAAGALAAMAVRAIHLLRTAEGRGDAYDAAPATDGVLAYAGPRDVRRVSLRGVNLAAIGVAQVVFGLGVLWWCGLALEKARAADLWFDAFLAFAGLSAVCHLFAGVRLLARRWNSAGAARATERWAGRSVLPMFLMGAVLSVWAGIAVVRGNDMYAGVALALSVIVCVTTGVFFLLSLAAARMLRGAGE